MANDLILLCGTLDEFKTAVEDAHIRDIFFYSNVGGGSTTLRATLDSQSGYLEVSTPLFDALTIYPHTIKVAFFS